MPLARQEQEVYDKTQLNNSGRPTVLETNSFTSILTLALYLAWIISHLVLGLFIWWRYFCPDTLENRSNWLKGKNTKQGFWRRNLLGYRIGKWFDFSYRKSRYKSTIAKWLILGSIIPLLFMESLLFHAVVNFGQ